LGCKLQKPTWSSASKTTLEQVLTGNKLEVLTDTRQGLRSHTLEGKTIATPWTLRAEIMGSGFCLISNRYLVLFSKTWNSLGRIVLV
jgi:hypothetical protein